MKRAFSISYTSVELELPDRKLDLHNDFDFCKVVVRSPACVDVVFVSNSECAAPHPTIALIFRGVDYLEFGPRHRVPSVVDLDEIGFLSPDTRDDSSLKLDTQADESDHLFLRFVGGDYIRIRADSATVKTDYTDSCAPPPS